MANRLLATGKVESLCINGKPVPRINMAFGGPVSDRHAGRERRLSGHDGEYIRTSSRRKGDNVLNWRMWSGLSTEEIGRVENELDVAIPPGCLLENMIISGIPNFSQLPPTTRLVFPEHKVSGMTRTFQAILAVWEENGPCRTVGERLAKHHGQDELVHRFVKYAQRRRGVVGLVLTPGIICVGDEVLVFPPVE